VSCSSPTRSDRARLWAPRVWPGAVLVGGEVRGTWRRAREVVSLAMWGEPSAPEREAIEAEAAGISAPRARGQADPRPLGALACDGLGR
jgi:hypothetical protein